MNLKVEDQKEVSEEDLVEEDNKPPEVRKFRKLNNKHNNDQYIHCIHLIALQIFQIKLKNIF